MKNIVITVFVILFSVNIYAEGSLKILFIGNSLTFFNDMPEMFQQLSTTKGKNVMVETAMFPGMSLRNIVRQTSLKDKLESDVWDIVIIQSDDITAFPDMYYIELNALNKCDVLIKAGSPNAKIIYEMLWGIKDGVTVYGEGYYSYEEYFQKMYDGTLHVANAMDYIIAPVGKAWLTSNTQHPEIELFSSDRAHPALPGSYLAACVFYATIFGESVEGSSYHSSLSNDVAEYFQKIASETVLESSELWNLDVVTSSINYINSNNFKLQVYPNPFFQKINFTFSLDAPSFVLLNIFDSNGKKIESVINQKMNEGNHVVSCDFLNGKAQMGLGIYFYNFEALNYTQTGKIIYRGYK